MRSTLLSLALSAFLLVPTATFAAGFSLDGTGQLLHNGQPFLLKGIYSVPTGTVGDDSTIPDPFGKAKDLGFNTAQNEYWAVDRPTAIATLDALNAQGMYGIVGVYSGGTAGAAYVNGVKNKPALLAYAQPDEPISTGISVTRLRNIYNTIKANDPNTPVLLVDYAVNAPVVARGTYDVCAYDEYPVGQESIAEWKTLLHQFIQNCKPKPTWLLLQAWYSGPWTSEQGWQQPTLAQLQEMVAFAQSEGITGYLAYEFNCSTADPNDTYCLADRTTLAANIKTVVTSLGGEPPPDPCSVPPCSLCPTASAKAK